MLTRRLPRVPPVVVDSRPEALRPVDPLLADIGVQLDLGKKAALGLLETVFGRPAVCLRGIDPGVGQHRLLDRFAKRGGMGVTGQPRHDNGGRNQPDAQPRHTHVPPKPGRSYTIPH